MEQNISIPKEVTTNIFNAAAENFYNNGYISGCVDGLKIGKKSGEGTGFLKGVIFTTVTVGVTVGMFFLGKALVDEIDDMLDINSSKKEPEESGEFREIVEDGEEDKDGFESV